MSNKPKTFKEWLRANKIILHRTHKLNKVDGAWVCEMKDAWNARDELAKEEIAKMQAEIDRKDVLLNRAIIVISALVDAEDMGPLDGLTAIDRGELFLEELTQGNKDE